MTQQLINIGTTANDGTGDPIRTAFDYANDNFTELYARMGACLGNKYTALQRAVKQFQVNSQDMGDLFYISSIVAGTLAGGYYTYTIEVSKTANFTSAGTVVMRYTTSAPTSPKTGLELIALSAYNSSGRFGYIGIDWSQLTTGTTYTCANYPEGGLFAVCGVDSGVGGGGGGGTTVIEDDTVNPDGSASLYVIDITEDIAVTLAAVGDIVGDIVMVNVSAFNADITGDAGTETFNGDATTITLAPQKSITIRVYSSNFVLVSGEYVEPV